VATVVTMVALATIATMKVARVTVVVTVVVAVVVKAEGGVKTAAVAWTPATTMATPCAWEWSLTCSVR
jgi:hypothetical protein